MNEVKLNTESDKSDEVTSYTLRDIPKYVHDQVKEFAREISYKRNRKYNVEQAYVEALKDWTAKKLQTA